MSVDRNHGGSYLLVRSREELRADLAALGFTPRAPTPDDSRAAADRG